ncbi:uncharacterized protein LOC111024116 [Momordica charantia]|uniref:Uncharacterized protein LOC111024116 n=1 Tax=Momordica charantia TaxID=3673 RepID=A0A6J1DT12_MOMCH|nr:uncharacterized protein LOC111024116 [Momordica charantia]
MRLFSLGTFSISSASFPPRALLLHFSQFSTAYSSTNYSFHSSSSSRRRDEESRNVKVSVWWDFENCNVPVGANVFKAAHLITAAVRANGIKGPVHITAFGDIFQLSRANQEALSSTGISLTHIPQGGKNSADRSFLLDLMYWVSQNPPPAHIFLISGDRDFANTLHRLRMNNYNVLLASPASAPSVLCSAASIMWHWNTLIRGENLVGKHLNQPPDGPYGSWYGHYNVPLEDPFRINEQPSSSRVDEVSEPSSDPNAHPISKTVIKQIRCIMKLYPKGIPITKLRSELRMSNISIKKFAQFLLSVPHIKLRTNSDGQCIVRLATPRAIEPFESSRGISGNDTEDQQPNVIAKLNNNGSSIEGTSVPEQNAEDRPMKVEQSSELGMSIGEAMEAKPSIVVEDSKQTSRVEGDSNMPSSIAQHSEGESGFFRRIWKRFLGSYEHNSSENGSHYISGKCSTSDDAPKPKTEGKSVKPMTQDVSLADRELLQKTAIVSSLYDNKSSSNPGLLGSIRKLFNFWRNDTNNGKVSEECYEQNPLRTHSGKHLLLSRNSFWQEMQSFMETPNGVELVSRSKTRLEMAQNLLEEGPSALKSLSNNDLLDFLELLISDKKWVEECPSETSPFKLTLPTAGKSSCTKPVHHSNGLTSIFLNKGSKRTLHGPQEHDSDSDSDKKNENIPQVGVSTSMTETKLLERTRTEILGDCQKLVDEILSEHPKGYNMGGFKRLFVEKYGYHLDFQKLGYQKLASLLQIIPGVTIASTNIVPTSKAPNVSNLETVLPSDPEKKSSHAAANSDNESSNPHRKDDDFESTWEELGPACTSCSRNEEESTSSEAVEATKKRPNFDYKPVVSEDELTESDGESCPTTTWRSTNEEESSLLQILDSWYSSKEENRRKDELENANETIDCSESSLKLF